MGKRRPINRRPFRRPPWRANRRPKRWNSNTSSVGSFAADGLGWYDIGRISTSADKLPLVFTLVSGQVDVEPWADEQEVTIDRIVGDVNLVAHSLFDASTEGALWNETLIVKMGLLVQEEVDAVNLLELNMFEQETMEDYEWMWLKQVQLFPRDARAVGNVNYYSFYRDIELDLSNRRKVGQSDELNFFCQFALATPTPTGIPSENLFDVKLAFQLREIMMSR